MAHVVVDALYKFAKQVGDTYYEGITKDPEFTARLETAVRVAGYIIPGQHTCVVINAQYTPCITESSNLIGRT